MVCVDCHGKMADGRFVLPAHAACKECHGDWIETKDISTNTCGKCHKVKDLQALASVASTNAPEEISGSLFVHTSALSNRCADCHGALIDKKLDHVPEMTRAVRVGIREKAHQWGLDCSACHLDLDRKTPPPSHRLAWKERHGAKGSLPDNACGVCHTHESCRECHQTTKPVSHNNLWRLKTHGTQAAWDRARCLVCHQQDSCAACHKETPPQSHTAGWLRNHCYNCHVGSSAQNSCEFCHAGGNSVLLHESFWPDFHNRSPYFINHCYACHFPGGAVRSRPGSSQQTLPPHRP